jgi:hypothetical protein
MLNVESEAGDMGTSGTFLGDTRRPAGWRVFWISGGKWEIYKERREGLPTAFVLLYLPRKAAHKTARFAQSSTSDTLEVTGGDNVLNVP